MNNNVEDNRYKKSTQVVMATYNGAAYLASQVSSIQQQLGDGQLIIHDDGSTDQTADFLQQLAATDARVNVIEAQPLGGASQNFSFLLRQSTAPYVLCADQDDVWLPEKLAQMLKMINFYEGIYGSQTPLLIHTDLRLINAQGHELAPSMWRYQHLNPKWGDQFNLLLTQNVVTGCAMLVNRALLDRALPVPLEATMHDHWLALVACAEGKIVWMEDPLVLYRQHGSNEVGARAFNFQFIVGRLGSLLTASPHTVKEEMALRTQYAQARVFAQRYPQSRWTEAARIFGELEQSTPMMRLITIVRWKFFMFGTSRNLAWMLTPRMHISRVMAKMRRRTDDKAL